MIYGMDEVMTIYKWGIGHLAFNLNQLFNNKLRGTLSMESFNSPEYSFFSEDAKLL